MPHRIVALGIFKIVGGFGGLAGSAVAYLQFAVVDPDHLKLLILAVGIGSISVIAWGLKELTPVLRELIPVYIDGRKKLRQMNLDLAAMDRKADAAISRTEDNTAAIEEVKRKAADEVEAAKAEARRIKVEADARIAAAEKHAAEKRHDLRDDLTARLLDAQAELAELKAKLGMTEEIHVEAINTVSSSVQEIAAHMDPPLAVETPRLSPSSDEIPAGPLPPRHGAPAP